MGRSVAFVLGFAAIGVVLLVATHAATPTSAIEAETGSITGNASVTTDTTASGGGAVDFGVAATGCQVPQPTRPSCTGVPASQFFRPYPTAATSFATPTVDHLAHVALNYFGEAYAVTTPNTVIDGLYIPGSLLIMADNVTVKNTYIQGMVTNEFTESTGTVHHPFTIQDSTIWPAACASNPGPAINGAQYTARRIQVFNHDKGFNSSTPGYVGVYDSYALLCFNPPAVVPPDGSHSGGFDALCTDGTCYNTVFNHNTIDNRNANGDVGMSFMTYGTHGSYPANLGEGFTADDNLVMGGASTIWFWYYSGPTWEIHNNHVVDKAWAYGPVDANGTCAGQNWTGNTLVNIDSTYDTTNSVPSNYNYNITSTVADLPCIN